MCVMRERGLSFLKNLVAGRERRERPQKKRTKKKCQTHAKRYSRYKKFTTQQKQNSHTRRRRRRRKEVWRRFSITLSVSVSSIISSLSARALFLRFFPGPCARVSELCDRNKYIFAGNFFFFSIFIPFSLSLSLDRYIKGGFVLSFEREREKKESSRGLPLFCFSLSRVCEKNS